MKKEGIIWSEGKKHHAISQPSEASSQKAISSPTLPKKRCPYKYPTPACGPDLPRTARAQRAREWQHVMGARQRDARVVDHISARR